MPSTLVLHALGDIGVSVDTLVGSKIVILFFLNSFPTFHTTVDSEAFRYKNGT